MPDYDATIRPKFKQLLPKKIAISKRIALKSKYEIQATLWVPDNPVSKFYPAIGFTIRHGKSDAKSSLRVVLQDMEDLRGFMGVLNNFILDSWDAVEKALQQAQSEWDAMHRKRTEAIRERQNPFSQAKPDEKLIN